MSPKVPSPTDTVNVGNLMPNEEKQRFVRKLQDSITLLARVANELTDEFNTYQARSYNVSGGTDPITDADISDTQVKASEVAAAITLAENLPKFLANNTPFMSDYRPAIAQLRTDM